jgi:hypothetical protein
MATYMGGSKIRVERQTITIANPAPTGFHHGYTIPAGVWYSVLVPLQIRRGGGGGSGNYLGRIVTNRTISVVAPAPTLITRNAMSTTNNSPTSLAGNHRTYGEVFSDGTSLVPVSLSTIDVYGNTNPDNGVIIKDLITGDTVGAHNIGDVLDFTFVFAVYNIYKE